MIDLSEWKRGINEKGNMLIVVICDCLDDDPNLLIDKMIWWHHCRLELLEFIVSSLWCEIVYFHWFMYTMMRHVVIMPIKNSFDKWLIQSWWKMVLTSDIVLMWNSFGERYYADGKYFQQVFDYCDLMNLILVIELLYTCDWTTWYLWLTYSILVIDWLDTCWLMNCDYWTMILSFVNHIL